MAISMLKIRRPLGGLIFNMGIAIPGKTVFLIETAPWPLWEFPLGTQFFCGHCNSTIAGLIFVIPSSMVLFLPIDVQQHGHWPVRLLREFLLGTELNCRHCNFTTTGPILSSMESSWPIDMQWQGHWPVGPLWEFPSSTQIVADDVTPQ